MDVQTAMERLYGDASLTEELNDDDAKLLLKWAENQITQLAAKFSDEAAFEEAVSSLLRVIKNANRVVGQRDFAEPTEQTERIDKMAEAAQGMGVIVASAQAADMKDKLDALSSTDAIKTLLNWITPGVNALTASAQTAEAASEANIPEGNPPQPDMPTPTLRTEPSAADQAKSLFSSLFDRLTDKDNANSEDET